MRYKETNKEERCAHDAPLLVAKFKDRSWGRRVMKVVLDGGILASVKYKEVCVWPFLVVASMRVWSRLAIVGRALVVGRAFNWGPCGFSKALTSSLLSFHGIVIVNLHKWWNGYLHDIVNDVVDKNLPFNKKGCGLLLLLLLWTFDM